jgi:hypothetical protein
MYSLSWAGRAPHVWPLSPRRGGSVCVPAHYFRAAQKKVALLMQSHRSSPHTSELLVQITAQIMAIGTFCVSLAYQAREQLFTLRCRKRNSVNCRHRAVGALWPGDFPELLKLKVNDISVKCWKCFHTMSFQWCSHIKAGSLLHRDYLLCYGMECVTVGGVWSLRSIHS